MHHFLFVNLLLLLSIAVYFFDLLVAIYHTAHHLLHLDKFYPKDIHLLLDLFNVYVFPEVLQYFNPSVWSI
jgi:hypothetical protein